MGNNTPIHVIIMNSMKHTLHILMTSSMKHTSEFKNDQEKERKNTRKSKENEKIVASKGNPTTGDCQ